MKPYDVTLTFTGEGENPATVTATVDASSPVAAVGLAATQVLNDPDRPAIRTVPNLTECHAIPNPGGVPA